MNPCRVGLPCVCVSLLSVIMSPRCHSEALCEELPAVVFQVGKVSREVFLDRCRGIQREVNRQVMQRLLAQLERIAAGLPEPFGLSLLYYETECLRLLKRRQQAVVTTERCLAEKVDVPECLAMRLLLQPGGRDKEQVELRIKTLDEIGRILPVSMSGSAWDRRRGRRIRPRMPVDPPPPTVPDTTRGWDSMIEIGALFEEMHLIQHALNAFLEALYSTADPGLSSVGRRETIEAQRAKIWMRIAKLEKNADRKQKAFHAYLRAAYLEASLVHKAASGLKECLKRSEQTTAASTPRLDTAKIKRIVELYRRLNMHPFALSFINEIGKMRPSLDLSGARSETERKWTRIVNIYRDLEGPDRYLYGNAISAVKDWGTVKILRPSDTFWK